MSVKTIDLREFPFVPKYDHKLLYYLTMEVASDHSSGFSPFVYGNLTTLKTTNLIKMADT